MSTDFAIILVLIISMVWGLDMSLSLFKDERVKVINKGFLNVGTDSLLYTDYEISVLRCLYMNGVSFPDIALVLCRSYCSVYSKARRMGILNRRRFYSSYEISIVKKYAGIYPAKHIASLLDRSLRSLYAFSKRNNISLRCYGDNSPNTKYSDEDVNFIRLLYDDGFSLSEIHSKFDHIPYSRIYTISCVFPDSSVRHYRHVSSDYNLKHVK